MTTQNDGHTLSGIRVIDITMAIAGPWATRMLADAGADVIKIEPPPRGDFTRAMPIALNEEWSAFFAQANSGKRSVCVDLKTQAGQEILHRLVERADVVVQNLRPLAAARCGVLWDELRKSKPDLVFCAVSGYGLQGPKVEKPGQDVAIQCRTGVALMTGKPGGDPAFPTWSLSDTLTGALAFNAVTAALFARGRDGIGRFVDVRMDRCVMQLHDAGPTLLREGHSRDLAERFGRFHPSLVVRGVVETSDGAYVALSAFRRVHWDRLAGVLGTPFDHVIYRSARFRAEHRKEICVAVSSLASALSMEQFMNLMASRGIPVSGVVTLPEYIASSPDWVVDVTISGINGCLGISPLNTDFGGENLRKGPPKLGQDTIPVLQAAGYSDDDIGNLFLNQIVSFPVEQLNALLDQRGKQL